MTEEIWGGWGVGVTKQQHLKRPAAVLVSLECGVTLTSHQTPLKTRIFILAIFFF